jgi:hypothetical protein
MHLSISAHNANFADLARVLAEMGLRLTPGLQVPNPENLQHLKDLVAARRALVADRVADGNRTGGHTVPLLQRLARRRRAASLRLGRARPRYRHEAVLA